MWVVWWMLGGAWAGEGDCTGAGVLVVDNEDNPSRVLLGKRRGTDVWDSFGGKSNKGEACRETASREFKEELLGALGDDVVVEGDPWLDRTWLLVSAGKESVVTKFEELLETEAVEAEAGSQRARTEIDKIQWFDLHDVATLTREEAFANRWESTLSKLTRAKVNPTLTTGLVEANEEAKGAEHAASSAEAAAKSAEAAAKSANAAEKSAKVAADEARSSGGQQEGTVTSSSKLRPSLRQALERKGLSHEDYWRLYCDTPTAGPNSHPGRRHRGLSKRRSFVVCVDGGPDHVRLTPSAFNRWNRALTLQTFELLVRSAGPRISIDYSGDVAIVGSKTQTATGVLEIAKAQEGSSNLGKMDDGLGKTQEGETAIPTSRNAEPSYHWIFTPTYPEGDVVLSASTGVTSRRIEEAIASMSKDGAQTSDDDANELNSLLAALRNRTDLQVKWVDQVVHHILSTENEAGLLSLLKAPQTVESASATVQVEDVFNLSLFGGLGFTTGDAATGDWSVSDLNGGTRIVSNGASYVDVELVFGATYYPSRRPRTASRFDVGVSIAMGVLGFDDQKVTVLRSIYTGPTVGWPRFSLTVGPVVNRGRHLRDGFEVGSVVPVGTSRDAFTEERWGLGLGALVHVPFQLLNGPRLTNPTNDGAN